MIFHLLEYSAQPPPSESNGKARFMLANNLSPSFSLVKYHYRALVFLLFLGFLDNPYTNFCLLKNKQTKTSP